MSERIEVGTVTEFENTDRKIVEIRGVEIGIIKVDDEYYAVLNVCPHQNGPVAEGIIKRKITADVPDVSERPNVRYESDTKIIRCPQHGWGFDIDSGENMCGIEGTPDLPTYDVVVEGGHVYLDL